MPVEKQLGRNLKEIDSKKQKRPRTNMTIGHLELNLSNLDEEEELELTNALKMFKENKKKKVKSDQNKLEAAQPCIDITNTQEGIATQTQETNSDEKISAQLSEKLTLGKSLFLQLCGPEKPAEEKEKEADVGNVAVENILAADKNTSLDINEILKFFLIPQKTCKQRKKENLKESVSLIDYEKQGAIPKNKFKINSSKKSGKNQPEKGEKSKTELRAYPKSINELDRKKNKKHSSGKDPGGDSPKCVKDNIIVFFQPFFYVVPENPSPDFVLPKGCYYVVPKELDSSINIVFHPQKNSSMNVHNFILKGNLELSGNKNDLAKAAQRSVNDQDRNEPFQLNITGLSEIERRLSENVVGDMEVQELLALKSVLVEELKQAVLQSNELCEKLSFVQICLNMKNSFSSAKHFYNKNKSLSILNNENHFTKLSASPQTDKNYLRKKVEECVERQDLFEDLIENECRRSENGTELDEGFKLLLQELPDYEFGILYQFWNECAGDKELILEFIEQKKKEEKLKTLKQFLILEFPDIKEAAAEVLSQNYLDDDEGFVTFISSEHLRRKIQNQVAVMSAALPESNLVELQRKCTEFQGDEERVQEYIKETARENRIQSQILNMQLILPDADPEFLRREVENLNVDDGAVNNLTDQLLESQDYPKLSNYKEALERKRLWRIYVDNFNVKEYLQKTPQPENYAGASGNFNKADKELIMKFLQSRYPQLSSEQLKQYLTDNRCNITKTCVFLDLTVEPVRLALSDFNNAAFNEAFLREICYIDFKTEIENFLADMETTRAIEREEARLNNAFLTCWLCDDEELIPSQAAACPDGHVYCKKCIFRYVNVKIGDGLYKFPCFFENCETYFTYATLEDILPAPLLSKIVKKQQAEEISAANVDGLETCSYCEYSYIPNPEDSIFKCQNPECLTEICRKCREKSHIPLRCEEIERPRDVEARKKIEETMTETLVRVCPKCQKKFLKTDGCNKISCPCGALICYLCRQIIYDYSHFSEKNSNSKCPLYSNNDDLHTRRVFEEGIRVRDEILRENPEIHIVHDPTITQVNQ